MFCLAAATRWLALACMVATPVACTCGKTEAGTADAGAVTITRDKLDGIKGSCEHRNTWKNRSLKQCTRCLGLSSAPACSCPADRETFSGVCAKEQNTKINAKECEPVWQCTYKCIDRTECDCFAKCFEGHEACHEIAAAVDTCVTETCDSLCR